MAAAHVCVIETSSTTATLRGAPVVPGNQCKRGASLMNDEPGDVWIDVPAETDAERLAAWRDQVPPLVQGFTAAYADEFTGDRSVESLTGFEAFLLDRLPSLSAAADRSARDLVTRAMAYLGETLMWVGGGRWVWGAGELADMPCVAFDTELGLEPLAPLRVIDEAVRVRDGQEFDRALVLIESALALRRADDPRWAPTKEATAGLDSVPYGTPHPDLRAWLAEGETLFASQLADRRSWEFSAESLDELETLIRERIAAPEEVGSPQHDAFVHAAAWYVGETVRRHKAAQWAYLPGELDEYNQWVGQPFVDQTFRGGHAGVPLNAVKWTLGRKPGFLRKQFDAFKPPPPKADESQISTRVVWHLTTG